MEKIIKAILIVIVLSFFTGCVLTQSANHEVLSVERLINSIDHLSKTIEDM